MPGVGGGVDGGVSVVSGAGSRCAANVMQCQMESLFGAGHTRYALHTYVACANLAANNCKLD